MLPLTTGRRVGRKREKGGGTEVRVEGEKKRRRLAFEEVMKLGRERIRACRTRRDAQPIARSAISAAQTRQTRVARDSTRAKPGFQNRSCGLRCSQVVPDQVQACPCCPPLHRHLPPHIYTRAHHVDRSQDPVITPLFLPSFTSR